MTQPDADAEASSGAGTWSTTLRGHRYDLDVTPGVRTRLVLRLDGREVHDETAFDDRRTIRLDDGRRVEVRLSATGRVARATAHDGGHELDLDAPAGSRAARLQEWGRAHPLLFAARHVVVKAVTVLVVLLGLGAIVSRLLAPAIRWVAERMPRIELPSLDLPRIPWPDIHLPRIPWPELHLPPTPGWLVAFLDLVDEYEWIVKPLLLGLLLAAWELRRQRRQRAERERREEAGDEEDDEAESDAAESR